LARPVFLFNQFPKLSETFILGEIERLAELGLDFDCYSLRRGQTRHLPPGAAELAARTRSPGPLSLLALPLLLAYWLIRRPRALLEALAFLASPAYLRPDETPVDWLCLLPGLELAFRLRRRPGVHLHAVWADHPATAGYIAAGLLGARFSLAVHAVDLWQRRALLRPKLRRAEFVTACSRAAVEEVGRLAPEARAKVKLIHHGLPPWLLDRPPAPWPAGPELRLAAVGRLVPKKGFDVLLRALARLGETGVDFRLTVVGQGPEQGRLERLSHSLGLAGRVSLVGARPQRQVIETLEASHLLVAPSVITPKGDRDGIPNVVLEAMACGRGVIASAVGGLAEVVEEGLTGRLCRPGDEAELARLLVQAGREPEVVRAWGQEARQRVRSRFDPWVNAQKIRDLLLASPAGEGR